jgi:hypothetical protein
MSIAEKSNAVDYFKAQVERDKNNQDYNLKKKEAAEKTKAVYGAALDKKSAYIKMLVEQGKSLEGSAKTANDALIEHCEPKSLTKAIKATPLPPLVIL